VLHAFQKKTQATAKRDIELAQKQFTELMRGAQ
jgi:phage-related protein